MYIECQEAHLRDPPPGDRRTSPRRRGARRAREGVASVDRRMGCARHHLPGLQRRGSLPRRDRTRLGLRLAVRPVSTRANGTGAPRAPGADARNSRARHRSRPHPCLPLRQPRRAGALGRADARAASRLLDEGDGGQELARLHDRVSVQHLLAVGRRGWRLGRRTALLDDRDGLSDGGRQPHPELSRRRPPRAARSSRDGRFPALHESAGRPARLSSATTPPSATCRASRSATTSASSQARPAIRITNGTSSA